MPTNTILTFGLQTECRCSRNHLPSLVKISSVILSSKCKQKYINTYTRKQMLLSSLNCAQLLSTSVINMYCDIQQTKLPSAWFTHMYYRYYVVYINYMLGIFNQIIMISLFNMLCLCLSRLVSKGIMFLTCLLMHPVVCYQTCKHNILKMNKLIYWFWC